MRAVFFDFGSVTRGDMDCAALERAVSPWQYHHDSTEAEVLERIREAEEIGRASCRERVCLYV